ncbi:hypothetical protein Nwi_0905 [Nitrobacter winogradskyi Nb-255]|uniref:Uncharacterized protein n=1 Tax=Nitrobacter winogradskyi (strain ATCC 25391 / DSM 10237 / CIP 104748 / NCIMB 11846 / Nb-255) TaxID=323098 RepID=Q3SU74_NITWN|nr:hypothetical protein Nwi_0905 [Nitrobacter winogradskyi Nb-255]
MIRFAASKAEGVADGGFFVRDSDAGPRRSRTPRSDFRRVYVACGRGYIESPSDIESVLLRTNEAVSLRIKDVAPVSRSGRTSGAASLSSIFCAVEFRCSTSRLNRDGVRTD